MTPEMIENIIIDCSYCNVDTAGQHESDCPLRIQISTPLSWYGWICPHCNNGVSPWEAICPCQNQNQNHYEITYGNTDNSSLGI